MLLVGPTHLAKTNYDTSGPIKAAGSPKRRRGRGNWIVIMKACKCERCRVGTIVYKFWYNTVHGKFWQCPNLDTAANK